MIREADELYRKLRAEPWINPWLDEEELYPGQDWDLEIQKAIKETDAIIVCISKNSTTKEGYVQKEIKKALDFSDEKPEGAVFIIPVRLEECKPPERLSKWHYADYFEGQRGHGLQRLLVSLKRRAESLALNIKTSFPAAQVSTPMEFSSPKRSQVNSLLYVPSSTNTLSNGITLIHVPAGRFLMGSTKESRLAFDNERPQHSVEIPYDYWIARFPVTNTQYDQYEKKGFEKGKENHPVVHVNWIDVMEYCKWLNNLLKAELPTDLVLRLPTEAEWEKAARGINGNEYPWGNEFDKNKCNTSEGDKKDTTPVGLYSPQGDSPYGCTDMSGNVWEWTHSLMKEYPYNVNDGREDEKASGARVLRGGSFKNSVKRSRCAYRDGYDILNFIVNLGFRVVASPVLS